MWAVSEQGKEIERLNGVYNKLLVSNGVDMLGGILFGSLLQISLSDPLPWPLNLDCSNVFCPITPPPPSSFSTTPFNLFSRFPRALATPNLEPDTPSFP